MEENKKDVLPLEGEPLTTPQISEPVVNALAAALSKIETYVPTQYINDGPPDIDAEHLNHAEQAIMRVTNLANGAADAISALQSQVTQLNSDLFSNVALVTDVHNIGKGCLFRAEYGAANTPTSDLGYIGISVYISSSWQFVICSPYAGGKLFFDSVNANGSWIGWKEITFK